jgi:hypothetical protein
MFLPSKGEARKMIQANGVSINKEKFADSNGVIDSSLLVNIIIFLFKKVKELLLIEICLINIDKSRNLK